MTFYYLKSSHGDFFGFNKKERALCVSHLEEPHDDFERVIGFTSEKFKDFLFLIPEETQNSSMKLKDYSFLNSIIPFRLKHIWGNFHHVIDIFHSKYISCPPTKVNWEHHQKWYIPDIAYLSLEKMSYDWEKIFLEEIPAEKVPSLHSWQKEFSAHLEEYFSPESSSENIRKILFSSLAQAKKIALLNLLLPFTENDLLKSLAEKILHDPTYLPLLKEKIGEDFWFKNALSPLLTWYHDGRGISQKIEVLEIYDPLHLKHNEKEAASFLEELTYQIRRLIKPHKKSCIVTTMRNEGLYILPWIAWHKQLGFEHFFVYSNENDDGSDEILRILAEQGIITWLQNKMGPWIPPHYKILKHAFAICPDVLNYEWSFVCDVDEYLQFNKEIFLNIDEFLERFKPHQTDAIMIHWRTLSADDKIDYKEAEISDRNLFYLQHDHHNGFKMMGRTANIIGGDSHILFSSLKERQSYRFPSTEKIEYPIRSANVREDCHDYSLAFLLHYYMRSSKEFLLRLYRGDAFDPYRVTKIEHGMFMKNNKIKHFNEIYPKKIEAISEDEKPSNPHYQEIFDELMELPRMKEAKENVMSITSHRIETLLTYLRENVEELGEDWQLFLKNFEENCG